MLYEQFTLEEERPTQTLHELVVKTERDIETKNRSVPAVTPSKTPTRLSNRIKLGTVLDDAGMVLWTPLPKQADVEGAEPSGSSAEKAMNKSLLA